MDENDVIYSDEEISDKNHSRLLEAISQLDKSQHIRKPTRTEPSLEISEYNLVKSSSGKNSSVNLHNLVKVLNKKSNQIDITKKLNKVRRNVKTIQKPLEKPEAQRIKRTVAYGNVKKTLDKWEPIIHANKAAEQLEFPLRKDSKLRTIETTSDLMNRFRIKGEFEIELEKLEPRKSEPETIQSEFPLTLKEMLERRKEAAKLRAQQSYREAKARRQNKIKSKKYHRIQRREKIKQQIKEFEILQKNNPEEALKKLEEIERARAEERVSLRHRSTGQWARNKQVRAKYDKESRQVLAQQLAVSRELTQKLKVNADEDDSENDDENNQINVINSTSKDTTANPWINGIQPAAEVNDFISGYRKYWADKNNKEIENGKQEKEVIEVTSTTMDHDDDDNENIINEKIDIEELSNFKNKLNELNQLEKHQKSKKVDEKIDKTLNKLQKQKKLKKTMNEKCKTKKKVKSKKIATVTSTVNGWKVEEINRKPQDDIDDIFKDVHYKLGKKIEKRIQKLKNEEPLLPKKTTNKKLKTKKYIPDLSLKSQRRLHPDLDEGLIETDKTSASIEEMAILPKSNNVTNKIDNKTTVPDIDPSSFVQIEPKYLKTKIPSNRNLEDALDDDDEANNNGDDQQALISEAFEDDDIVDEFRKEKKDEIDANTPKDIDLSLPGWGTWGGKNIKNKRRKKRFIIKKPKKIPRKDDNKGNLILKDHKDTKIREHQVKELPFPFTRVQDFEASIRAPLGNTFLPETAYKRLIKPSVKVKMGKIIEPMDDDQLVLNKIRKLKKGIL